MRSVARKSPYIALYGNTKIEKAWCTDCDGYSFVVDDKLVCCGQRASGLPSKYKRESEPEFTRRLPPVAVRRAKLEEQNYRCFYCERRFDSLVYRKGKPVRLKQVWDHQVPHSYSQNNQASNFVAACHICNGIKSSFLFQTLEEAQVYITEKWAEKGIM